MYIGGGALILIIILVVVSSDGGGSPQARHDAQPESGAGLFLGWCSAPVCGRSCVLFLVPLLVTRGGAGRNAASMLLVIGRGLLHRPAVSPRSRAGTHAPGLGSLALALLLGAELLLAVVLQDQSLAAYVASRDPVSGTVAWSCCRCLR